MKKEIKNWAKSTTLDDAYNVGFGTGVRLTIEFLAKEHFLDSSSVTWLLESKYFEEIKNLDK